MAERKKTDLSVKPERLTEVYDWRKHFKPEMLKKAQGMLGLVIDSEYRPGRDYRITMLASPKSNTTYQVSLNDIPDTIGDKLEMYRFRCSCPEGRRSYWNTSVCVHQAVLMLKMEEENGPIILKESEYGYRRRLYDWHAKVLRLQRLYGIREHNKTIPVAELLQDNVRSSSFVAYDLDRILKGLQTTEYYAEQYKNVEKGYRSELQETIIRGEHTISGKLYFTGESASARVELEATPDRLLYLYSDISLRVGAGFGYGESSVEFASPADSMVDEFGLAALAALIEKVNTLNVETDQTDKAAELFFTNLKQSEQDAAAAAMAAVSDKPKMYRFKPRIVIEDGEAKLTFRLGEVGKRLFVIRNLDDMMRAVHAEGKYELSRTASADFAKGTFTDESLPALEYVERRLAEIDAVNDKLNTSRYGYNSMSLPYAQTLGGSMLDNFYDTMEGKTLDYTDKSNDIKETEIAIGHRPVHFKLTADRLSDARGRFAGVAVTGIVPVVISGASGRYLLNKDGLSRLTYEEEKTFRPFRTVADASGYFRFQVGLNRLSSFYYRILPSLLENPIVDLDDHCAEEAEQYLPPQPVFRFFLDYNEGVVSCRTMVSYEDKAYNILQSTPDAYRDTETESSIVNAVRVYLPTEDAENQVFMKAMDDDELFAFMKNGIGWLEKFGMVSGTNAFRVTRVRPAPLIQVGVAVKNNLLDLSVTSKELSDSELIDILNSYIRKKKYHRLNSGEYVDLENSSQLEEVRDLMNSLSLEPIDAIKKKIHLPMYRALYIDRMLEEHNGLAASRDRTYRTLVKNFKTIGDSDYDLPSSLEDTLRPYQAYGFKWLSTLQDSGFGGILADEMGLGKTLQTIALLVKAKDDGNKEPSLIVCPASLVFNWKEEFSRFGPSLKVCPLASGAAARRKQLQEVSSGEYDVYVTSYDLLKRDIEHYENIQFHTCVLDEAQFIKNQKTSAAKAVKLIHAAHRYALTGTPIENRLSELWSIFDYLMPGFLYSSDDFVRNYETPIARNKDEQVTAKLKKMVSPFILRRKKEDVLKDLPEKLEEVRYARFAGEQQKIYDGQVVHMRQVINEISNNPQDRIKVFAEMTRIRQICCDPSLVLENYKGESAKREACLELIESAIDGGHRILLFSQFVTMLELLEKDLQEKGIEYYKITGSTPKDRRVSLVHQFNEGDVPVFLVSLKAGGTGLNLTGADVVIHYDPWWNIAAMNQATDRAHRIGQTRKVTVYKMIAKDTIEEKIMELQEAKRDLADAILEGKGESLMSLSREELLALFS